MLSEPVTSDSPFVLMWAFEMSVSLVGECRHRMLYILGQLNNTNT